MPDLRSQIQESAEKLRIAYNFVSGNPSSALPIACYEFWIERTQLHSVIHRTEQLIVARQAAWDLVNALAQSQITKSEAGFDFVLFNGIEMHFSVARHLAFTSYAATTWSIYDRLSNVCGRLSASGEFADNPKNNPKACDDFFETKKSKLGFSIPRVIASSYQWPLRASYKLRNWFVHEGYEEGETPMFIGPNMMDRFVLHDDAIQLIEKACGYKSDGAGDISSCCIEVANEPWPTKDLFQILPAYNDEVDLMFTALLKWCVDSIDSQVRAFAARTPNEKLP